MKTNISPLAKTTAAKLPPDVLMHPMPLPDRIAYAEKIIQEVLDESQRASLKYAVASRRSRHTHSAIAAVIAFSGTTAALALNPEQPMPFHYSAILGLAVGVVAYAWIRDTWRMPCTHRRVTVVEDGGRCTDCRCDVSYNPETRNWE